MSRYQHKVDSFHSRQVNLGLKLQISSKLPYFWEKLIREMSYIVGTEELGSGAIFISGVLLTIILMQGNFKVALILWTSKSVCTILYAI